MNFMNVILRGMIMRKFTLSTALIAGIAMTSFAPASAYACGEFLDSYIAKLGSADHFNSSGARLTSVAAVLRQDRANFHRFGLRDAGDETDAYFHNKGNRAKMERLINRGSVTSAARRRILNGTPWVEVTICGAPDAGYVDVR